MNNLAINGGTPIRDSMLPYSRQSIDDKDIAAVVDVLKSDWLTTGPKVDEFEKAFAGAVDAKYAIAVSSGTAALHCAMYALNVGPGDEVIVPVMTFAASANCILYQGATPVFVDVEPDTLLINIKEVEAKITERTKAIIAVDYAGQPCDYNELQSISDLYGVPIIADACHALGGKYHGKFYWGQPVGSLADLNVFSLHPVKHITTGEGGIITTDNHHFAERMRIFRNHGIPSSHATRKSWFYEMVDLGYNYRLTDIQCVLGISQLRESQFKYWVERRRNIAATYDKSLLEIDAISPLINKAIGPNKATGHAYHLYVVQLDLDKLIWPSHFGRFAIYDALRAEGIGVNVHYIPVHLHPYYRAKLGTRIGLAPVAEAAYERILSLPIFPTMTNQDISDVVQALQKVLGADMR